MQNLRAIEVHINAGNLASRVNPNLPANVQLVGFAPSTFTQQGKQMLATSWVLLVADKE